LYNPPVQERLQKILSRAGVASRRGAEAVIEQGRVTVNGTAVSELGSKADVSRDDIRVDGVRLQAPERPVYLLLNKPKGVITTRRDPAGRSTVMDLVPAVVGLFPVGRLDVNTEGLLLLTNDGGFAERVAHPRYAVERVYHAKVHRVPEPRTFERLLAGVRVEGQRMAFDAVRVVSGGANPWLEVRIHEGRNREVRRVLESVGHPVSKLKRVGLGSLTARGLAVGEFRQLKPAEVKRLLGPSAQRPQARPRPPASRPRRPPRAPAPASAPASAPAPAPARRKAAGAAPGRHGSQRPRPRRTAASGRTPRRGSARSRRERA
jgi:pseudouridine synthase